MKRLFVAMLVTLSLALVASPVLARCVQAGEDTLCIELRDSPPGDGQGGGGGGPGCGYIIHTRYDSQGRVISQDIWSNC